MGVTFNEEGLENEFKPSANESKKYLNSAKDEKGNTRYFKGTMMERLFSKNRKELFTDNFEEVKL